MLRAFISERSWLDQHPFARSWYWLWMLQTALVLRLFVQVLVVIGLLAATRLVVHTKEVLWWSRCGRYPCNWYCCTFSSSTLFSRIILGTTATKVRLVYFSAINVNNCFLLGKTNSWNAILRFTVNCHWQQWFFSENQKFNKGQRCQFLSSFCCSS